MTEVSLCAPIVPVFSTIIATDATVETRRSIALLARPRDWEIPATNAMPDARANPARPAHDATFKTTPPAQQ